ncbi:DNA-binding FadR family transcriptional regulator [Curtobacterium sp. PhB130]|uniref:FadR/GntR family transcriptional regulator n=1 Tax=unclassified Curtobacterium TaxID=257496 RepID=UPI000F4CB165|nr:MULTISPECIES: FCD domain-containing protein [unclassified Curtobacterium]ROP63837.1 DNA-binding FadR family transcriptional regulator [Curtobacterium sp. ZW137]ROS78050.1 DNA-binding FadR family transcriptional regulator [Curtobacterium sp. PhB130]TCK65633.1 DNA-binding FadR family transcriptional regulator [Curtobacterium sp. PhB136]
MTSTFDRVLDELGSAIVSGTLPTGHVDSIDGFVVRTGASRSIVREATRVLVGLGLLSAGRRVGLRVRPREDWDVIDPRVVGWRLAGSERDAVLAELRALRRAVEPEAAAAAADRVASGAVPPDGLEALVAAAGRLAADGADAATRLQSDRAVHRRLLDLSGNAVFARLAQVVERALDEREHIGPDPHDMALHVALADAVARGDAPGAAAAMREIVDRT